VLAWLASTKTRIRPALPATMGTVLSRVWVLWVSCSFSMWKSRVVLGVLTVKVRLTVPPGVVTTRLPEVAPAGTVKVS